MKQTCLNLESANMLWCWCCSFISPLAWISSMRPVVFWCCSVCMYDLIWFLHLKFMCLNISSLSFNTTKAVLNHKAQPPWTTYSWFHSHGKPLIFPPPPTTAHEACISYPNPNKLPSSNNTQFLLPLNSKNLIMSTVLKRVFSFCPSTDIPTSKQFTHVGMNDNVVCNFIQWNLLGMMLAFRA